MAALLPGAAAVHAESPVLDVSRLARAPVRYVAAASLSAFPAPVVHWRRPGLLKDAQEKREIEDKLIYPFVIASTKPVSAIVVDLFPGDDSRIGVWAIHADGDTRETTISRSPDGTFAPDAFRVLLARPTP
jgi:hypothetical protein